MKRITALVLAILLIMITAVPALAAPKCDHDNCRGRLIYKYGPWESKVAHFEMVNGELCCYILYERTVSVKCTENSKHKTSYTESKWVKK